MPGGICSRWSTSTPGPYSDSRGSRPRRRAGAGKAGEFGGLLRDGSTVHLRFADFFRVGTDGLFTRRDTFFFAPMV